MEAGRREVVAGVDGCPGGWVVVTDDGTSRLRAEVLADLGPLLEAVRDGGMAAVAVDMPMGLLHDRPRQSDRAARAVLGPRRSSVFPTPVRAVLAATTYPEACELSRAACGKALSKQAWFLVDRIRHLDELIEPDDQQRVIEAHPECAFLRLAERYADGRPLAAKKTPEGQAARVGLLTRHLGSRFTRLWRQPRPRGAGFRPDDLLDAAVLTVTARHVLAGTSIHLGPERDPHGKLCQVVY